LGRRPSVYAALKAIERIHGLPWRVFRDEATIGGKDNRLEAHVYPFGNGSANFKGLTPAALAF
jgi:hypothetical protein